MQKFEYASLDDFCKLHKNSQRWYFAWENLKEAFLMLVVVLNSLLFLWCWLLLFLRFRATFPCHRHSTLASRAREGLHQLWALPWLLSIALLFRHIFTASATVLSEHFLSTGVFYLTLLPDIPGFPGSPQFFLEGCRASHWGLKHTPGPSVCLNQTVFSKRYQSVDSI